MFSNVNLISGKSLILTAFNNYEVFNKTLYSKWVACFNTIKTKDLDS